ncbi:MAG: Holliday junction resolvase RuvX [Wenzhouxiangellaceae bacterium]|nr:Holliday junction resolvase RuvX [Wenzhouxiangellaceae bacterium]
MPEQRRGAGRSGIVLGIDFGKRRIGLATGNLLTGTARPLDTISHSGEPFGQLELVFKEWKPACIIVGLPLAQDGTESDMSRATRQFAARLQLRFPDTTLKFQDERFSSRAAESQFAQARRDGHARRRDARNLDSIAAAVILESWLAAQMQQVSH